MSEKANEKLCPCCREPMDFGSTPISGWVATLLWFRKGISHNPFLLFKYKYSSEEGYVLTRRSYIPAYHPSWYCRKCGYLLIDLKAERSKPY